MRTVLSLLLVWCAFQVGTAQETTIYQCDFNKSADSKKWVKDTTSVGKVTFLRQGVDGSRCLFVENKKKATKGATYMMEGLVPGDIYRFSAMVKTENVKEGRGAVLSIVPSTVEDQIWNASSFLYDTNDWTEVYVDVEAPESGIVGLYCSLGGLEGTYNGGLATGKAWFDNIKVENVTKQLYIQEGKYIRFVLPHEMVTISKEKMAELLSHWDDVYEAYKDLVGNIPYNGRKITIMTTPGIEKGYWALAGNPILWNSNVRNQAQLERFAEQGDWCFGLMHEIAHVFNVDCTDWDWNDEIFANFRMSYALEKLQGAMTQNKTLYVGENSSYYKLAYDKSIGAGKAENNGDAIQYTLMRIKSEYGWIIYKKAFRELRMMKSDDFANMTTPWQKLKFFWSVLSKHAGEDVEKTCYTLEELRLLEKALNN